MDDIKQEACEVSCPTLEALREKISKKFPSDFISFAFKFGQLSVEVKREAIVRLLTWLRDDVDCLFQQLLDIASVDYPERPERFELVYHLLSLRHNLRIRVKVRASEDTLVPSVSSLFSSASWCERESWDMFGILFSGHPDLRRILCDYGFDGHPLRKDFPLSGLVEVSYDTVLKRVVYKPVELQQELRNFDSVSPWESPSAVQGHYSVREQEVFEKGEELS